MPGVRNKILIDDEDYKADSFTIRQAFRSGLRLAKEIEGLGASGECNKTFLLEQETICADLHKYNADIIQRQRAFNEKLRKFADSKLPWVP